MHLYVSVASSLSLSLTVAFSLLHQDWISPSFTHVYNASGFLSPTIYLSLSLSSLSPTLFVSRSLPFSLPFRVRSIISFSTFLPSLCLTQLPIFDINPFVYSFTFYISYLRDIFVYVSVGTAEMARQSSLCKAV